MRNRKELEGALLAAVDDFLKRSARASNRMEPIADYCIGRLRARKLPELRGGSLGEKKVLGFGRKKNWDVSCTFAGQPRVLVSLKSILRNVAGTVPNRVDDLMGEVASIQMIRPEIVIGYVEILDVKGTTSSGGMRDRARNRRLFQQFKENVERLAVRGMPNWTTGLFEACWLVEIDTADGADLIPHIGDVVEAGEAFFDKLARLAREREPGPAGL